MYVFWSRRGLAGRGGAGLVLATQGKVSQHRKEGTVKLSTDINVDAKLIADRLNRLDVDELVPYSELSDIIKRDVQRGGRYVMDAARRRLLRDEGKVFGAVTNEGLKRLNDAEKVDLFNSATKRIRRKARRTSRILMSVNYDSLTPEEQTRHNLGLSVMGVISHITDGRKVRRLEAKIAEKHAIMAARESLSLFANDGDQTEPESNQKEQ